MKIIERHRYFLNFLWERLKVVKNGCVQNISKYFDSAYETSPPRRFGGQDEGQRCGYVVFWQEWTRRRNPCGKYFFCPAVSRSIDESTCWEYCFAYMGASEETIRTLEQWIWETRACDGVNDFHFVCENCSHRQWRA